MNTLNRQERVFYIDKVRANFPPNLLANAPFVCWRSVPTGKGKPKKVPTDPKNLKGYCSATDPRTWADFETAAKAYIEDETLAGIGIVFTDDDPNSGIDLDRCVEDGRLGPWAEQVVRNAGSYAEVSLSGTGVKIFGTGILPAAIKKDEDRVEAYSIGRFFTVTGEKLAETPSEAHDIQRMLNALWDRYCGPGGEYGPPVDTAAILSGLPEGMRDNELWRLACKFRRADIPVDAAESLILEAASKCFPPFPADDALAKVRRAYEKYPAGPDRGITKADGPPGVEVLRDRMIECVKGSLCHSMGSWREYDQGVWGAVEDDRALVVASDVVEDAIPEGVRYSLPLVHQVSGSARLKLKVPNDAWDADPDRLAFINGALNLRTFRFSEHAPEHYITAGVPYDYDPDATGPYWDMYESYLRGALDPETVDFILEYMGYCLTADTSEEKMLFLEGPRGSGKSTLVEAIEAMLGPDLCLSQSLAGLLFDSVTYG